MKHRKCNALWGIAACSSFVRWIGLLKRFQQLPRKIWKSNTLFPWIMSETSFFPLSHCNVSLPFFCSAENRALSCLFFFFLVVGAWVGRRSAARHSAFQVALLVKNPACHCRSVSDAGSIPGSRRSLGEEHGNPLQYSCLENPMDRGAWCPTVHRVAKSRTWLKLLSTHAL